MAEGHEPVTEAFHLEVDPLEEFAPTVKTKEISDEAKSFARNVDRVFDMLAMLPHLIYWSKATQRFYCQAAVNAKQQTDFSALIVLLAKNQDQAVYKEYVRLKNLWIEERKKQDPPWRHWMDCLYELANIVLGLDRVGGKTKLAVRRAKNGFSSLLASQLIGSWTAFESLATDLWIKAVNLRPMSLGVRAIEAKQFDKKPGRVPVHPPAGEKKKVVRNPIRMELLLEHRFNLGDKLGTVIYRSRKFDFNRGDGILYAYTVLFGDPAKALFQKHVPELRRLEAIRNCLVHKGGVVDRQFQRSNGKRS